MRCAAFVLALVPCEAVQVQVPYGLAAVHASNSSFTRKCDHYKTCENVFGAMEAWRYAYNNARKALAYATKKTHEHIHVREELRQLGRALHEFHLHPNRHAFEEVSSAGRILFDHYHDVLTGENATIEVEETGGIGVDFRDQSANIPFKGGNAKDQFVTLSNGVKMPLVGFGTWELTGQKCYETVRWALGIGYRKLDTAQVFGNEKILGKAIKDAGLKRKELFISTKLSNFWEHSDEAYARQHFEEQLEALGTDYIDLYMLHAPSKDPAKLKLAWSTIEALYTEGKVKAIGVSNYSPDQLKELFEIATIKPQVLQNKFSVYHPGEHDIKDTSILQYAKEHKIHVVAYSVGNAWPYFLDPLEDPHVLAVAERVKKTPYQVLQRHALQMGVSTLTRSSVRERALENKKLFDFKLSNMEMQLLNGLITLSTSVDETVFGPKFCADVYKLGGQPRAARAEL